MCYTTEKMYVFVNSSGQTLATIPLSEILLSTDKDPQTSRNPLSPTQSKAPLPPPPPSYLPPQKAATAGHVAPIPSSEIKTAEGSNYSQCPFCGEKVLAIAKKCKHCGEFIDPVLLKSINGNTNTRPPQPPYANTSLPVYSICGSMARLDKTSAILMIRELSLEKIEIAFREDDYSLLSDELKAEISSRYSEVKNRIHSSIQSPARTGKNKTTAALLAILLGGFGIHKFYLGKIEGIFYLLFFWTYIPSIIGLIEGIMYISMSDAEWQSKYC